MLTTPSVARAGLLDDVTGVIGDGVAGTFGGSREHTPAPVVLEAAEEARRSGADGVVSLGGSSVVDLAKGVVMVLPRARTSTGYRSATRRASRCTGRA